MKVWLYYIGKARDAASNAIAADFVKRSSRYAACEMREIHPDRFDIWSRHSAANKVLLDPAGKQLTSPQFVDLISKGEMEVRDQVFVIGGHDGLPPGWAARADQLLSLSAMTFPHELARAMLAEQIYRGFCMLHNHPYVR